VSGTPSSSRFSCKVIDRAKFQPKEVGPDITKDDVAFLGTDPGSDVDEAWWEEMLVQWFEVLEEEKPAEEGEEEGDEKAPESESSSEMKSKA